MTVKCACISQSFVLGLLSHRMILVTAAAGKAMVMPPKSQNPTLEGRFVTTGGSCEIILGPSTSLIVFSYGMNAEIRNTKPITKEPTPSCN